MTELLLTGLDGANPLAFLASLGLLNVASDAAGPTHSPRLAWRDTGGWRPVLTASAQMDREHLVEAVIKDLATWKDEPAIALEYDGERDLKPPPMRFRDFLEDLVDVALSTQRRSLDFAAAFATDVAVDNNGNTKPTALHFTAGQQKFLLAVRTLVDGVTAEDVEEALFGPWRYERSLPVLRWDSTSARDYALRAGDPSKDKPTGVPGADWLAFRGLSFLPTMPSRRRILTTCCEGEWKTGRFRWPLWTAALTRDTVRSVLSLDGLQDLNLQERRARGIGMVLESRIRRSDQGGYGSFSPANVV